MSSNDPMLSATEPTKFTNEFYGKLDITAKYVYTAKGERPRDFEPGDDPRKRSTEVSLTFTTIDAMGLTRPVIERRHIDWTTVWQELVWLSLKGLGMSNLPMANGQWYKVVLVGTGRKYTSKTTGKEVEETAMQFLESFPTEAACVKAYESEAGVSHEDNSDEELAVVRALVGVSKGDMAKLAANLKAAKSRYTVTSPEVIAILMESAVPA